jgi:hypothetical protein
LRALLALGRCCLSGSLNGWRPIDVKRAEARNVAGPGEAELRDRFKRAGLHAPEHGCHVLARQDRE